MTEEVGRIVVQAWIDAKTVIRSMVDRNVEAGKNDGQVKIVASTVGNLAQLHAI